MSLVNKGMAAITKSTIIPSGIDEFDVASPMSPTLPYFFGQNGSEFKFNYGGIGSAKYAYRKCPPLTAIINRKAQAHINGKTLILNTQKKEATSNVANNLRKLFKRPNPLQSWKQFEAQQKIYIQLFGFCLVLPIVPAGFEDQGPIAATKLWNIPPYMLDIKESQRLFLKTDADGMIESITLNYKGQQTLLRPNAVYMFKDFTPSFDSLIIPDSRVRALEMPINNIIGAYESKNVLINYRGALGILTPDTGSGQYVPMNLSPADKKDLQSDFLRYGLARSQWKFIISPAALKWQQMGVPTKDLMLKEEIEDCTKALCDAYGYPPHLLGLIDPTFNNQLTAQKGLYQDTIIPEAESMYEEWNTLFRTEEHNITIVKDYCHVAVLQEDRVAAASARAKMDDACEKEFKNNVITLNRWLELQGEVARTDGLGDLYYYQLAAQGVTFGTTPAQTDQNGDKAKGN